MKNAMINEPSWVVFIKNFPLKQQKQQIETLLGEVFYGDPVNIADIGLSYFHRSG